MDWNQILIKARQIREEFLKTHKCLNNDREIKTETLNKHINNLVSTLEKLRVFLNVNYNRLTQGHKVAAETFFLDIREKLITVASRKGITIDIPTSLHEEISFTPLQEIIQTPTMTQTVVEFINTATKLIPDFDGKSENLRSFLDALTLVDAIKGEHEAIAISLIKTKLKGNSRNLIDNENTIAEISTKLRTTVKGESVEVVTAKLMNIRQSSKTATNYCNEIETLTKSLENAYINDGINLNLASKYATQAAVRAITKNCTLEKVKLIMEAGQFTDMNEVISKFVGSCTEATGQQNTMLYQTG
ncbi:PREDICTED: uncharacterized protein LOC108383115 [Rhagoletis zephyria]|uniref:uncharacterized protein LOC108357912 n=2 Tax=Rhagoletis zephyria TaxID=28612 RepID=UPI0008114205|nr:PREDICTED: uncharacterized protein LOC108357912 [Rhagoletis zephyria]XP_017464495.1 PREDICTED: uncharacterized protein LOC108357920 [Rhagoletis zephyria]XP_017469691.1 PREDICTED: uncharacterized protein LOC108361558 [Rhagoletis zephyria]XP_017477444.1 PREDICTED: uncharacterized protein LOC108367358 [Rhagoletis zephyria]XP_017477849.1 PREDICTED: uncharacterized protein LOC108367683 [Rhagoletis zephyria]XP_017494992.1 PREDICTED: uncharacterized protein LOC108383115 [Rhagoletis zephyria]